MKRKAVRATLPHDERTEVVREVIRYRQETGVRFLSVSDCVVILKRLGWKPPKKGAP